MARKRYAIGLAAITGAGLLLRLVYVVAFERSITLPVDGAFYHAGANNFASGMGFDNPIGLAWTMGALHVPSAAHPPAYIVALALPSALGWQSVLAHQIWSCLFGTATIAVVGLNARLLAGERASLIAAAIAAVYPNLWVNDALVMSETFTMLVVALMLLACYRFMRSQTNFAAAIFGFTIALFALSRGEGVLALPLLLVAVFVALRSVPWQRRATSLLIVAVCATIGVLPWIAYNNRRFERPVLISTNLGPTALEANCDISYHGDLAGYWSDRCLTPSSGDESQNDAVYRREAWSYARSHLSELPTVVAERMGRTFGFYRPAQQLRLDQWETRRPYGVALAGLIAFYALVPFAVMGAIRLRRDHVPIGPLLAVFAVVIFAVTITFGETRYRAPAEIPIVLLAGCGIDAVISGRLRTVASTRS